MTDAPSGTGDAEPGSAEGVEPTGKRRSTFTPLPRGLATTPAPAHDASVDGAATPAAEAATDLTDDDAIADALAAQFLSYTAPVPVIQPDSADADAGSPDAADEEDLPLPDFAPVAEPEPAQRVDVSPESPERPESPDWPESPGSPDSFDPAAAPRSFDADADVDSYGGGADVPPTPPVTEPDHADRPASSSDEPDSFASEPDSFASESDSFEAEEFEPDPNAFHDEPIAPEPEPEPEPVALVEPEPTGAEIAGDESDLDAVMGPSATLEAIELLEQQLRLRDEDPDAFRAWQEALATGAVSLPGGVSLSDEPAAMPAEEPISRFAPAAESPPSLVEPPAFPASGEVPTLRPPLPPPDPEAIVRDPALPEPTHEPAVAPIAEVPLDDSAAGSPEQPSGDPTAAPGDAIAEVAPAELSPRLDFASMPPPIGIEPADIPPYAPGDDAAAEFVPPGAPAEPMLPEPLEPPVGSASAGLELAPREFDDRTVPRAFVPPPATVAHEGDIDLDLENDDVVDEVDRLTGSVPIAVGAAGIADVLAPPSEPIAVQRVADDDPLLAAQARHVPRAREFEATGVEPTPLDRRAGRSVRLFWLWFAPNASVVSIAVGAILAASGMSLRQAVVAALTGVAVSWIPLGFGTLAGKWTGQPVMVVSRAVFGHLGNLAPAALALITRVFWGGALLWLFAASAAHIVEIAGVDPGLGIEVWTFFGILVGVIVVAAIAVGGYGLLALVQLISTVVAAILIVGLIVLTSPRLDFATALSMGDGSWILAVPGAVLVFSVVGLAWAQSSGDMARYQRPEGWGGSSMVMSSLGATVPAFALIAWGALLAASDPAVGAALATDPVGALAALLPLWYPIPLLLAVGVGLLSAATLATYSAGFALQSLGVRLPRTAAAGLAVALVALAAAVLAFLSEEPAQLLFDLVIVIAVPVSAWVGILAAEMMFRSTRLDASSLLERGRHYPDLRVGNVAILLGATAIGWGLTSAEISWLSWQGFLFALAGVPADDLWATSNVGVFVALGLGLIATLATALPAVRRQERSVETDSVVHTGAIGTPRGGAAA